MLLSSVFVSFDLQYHGGADRSSCVVWRPPAVTRHWSPRARSCSTGPLTRFFSNHGNNRDLPGSWGASISGLPRSSTPEGRLCLALFGSSVQPPIRQLRRPLRPTRFRGSLTRLPGSLSTLPRLRYLRRARLASGWWPAFTGWAFFTHKAPLESFRFNMSTHVIPSSFSRLILARCLRVEVRNLS